MIARPLAGAAFPQEQRPVFRATVDRVTISVTVRDRRGRPVTSLKAADFHLLDNGEPRQILEFDRDTAPISLAILADMSGSMDVAFKRGAAREAAQQLVGFLTPNQDRVGLYAFDAELSEVQPLRPAPGDVLQRMDTLEPWGKTRLFDAIAETGRKLAETGAARRAVVVLTDGYDNASQLTPGEVSAIASSIDVPVYAVWCRRSTAWVSPRRASSIWNWPSSATARSAISRAGPAVKSCRRWPRPISLRRPGKSSRNFDSST
jgi:VWFA-related protein